MFGKESMDFENYHPRHNAFKAMRRGHEFRFVIASPTCAKAIKFPPF
jgi:hypothetical protein